MLKKWKEWMLALMVGFLFPGMLFSVMSRKFSDQYYIPTQSSSPVGTTEDKMDTCNIIVLTGKNRTVKMDIDEYVTSVVLREMPANFEMEALKAQAVVARTYALKRQALRGKHENADVCTDASCCQGFYTQEQFLSTGGSKNQLEKVKTAVELTAGQVLVYEGELIDATYFSCSGGMTEDAKAVWGADIPYLRSTESPGEEAAKYYVDTVTFSASEFSKRLGFSSLEKPNSWIESVTYTEGGGVDTIKICGKSFKGTVLRKKLNLKSTAFVMTIVGDHITITTKGFGHRVGMSQYGADAMAVRGCSYEEILSHYYKETELVKHTQ